MSEWSYVPLGTVIEPVSRAEEPISGETYRQIGVRLWGEGAYERDCVDGGATKYQRLFRAEADDVIVNKIWARNGSVAVVPSGLSGCFGSSEFPMFAPNRERVFPAWLHWLTKTPSFWAQCEEKSRGTSGKNRIRPERFMEIRIPLPSVAEQRRVVARIEGIVGQVTNVRALRAKQDAELHEAMFGAFWRIAERAIRLPMREVAPLVRRPVKIAMDASYPELGVRSFGKGSFHKPALTGAELGNKRIFRIEPGDLVFSNVFAWEGAIAVAKAEDAGRYGSHRFITCVPHAETATALFLCYYFLTDRGLSDIRAASPGGAGRNRTLGLKALEKLLIPVPPIEAQHWFDRIQAEARGLKQEQFQNATQLDALLPAVLDQAFSGKL